MIYIYYCKKCSKLPDRLFRFETKHGMNEKPKVKCPKCGGLDTEQCFSGFEPPTFYIHGQGYLDVKGRRRDMHLHKLMNDDPYGHMRQPGEKEELAASLRKGGKHNPKGKKFYVTDRAKK